MKIVPVIEAKLEMIVTLPIIDSADFLKIGRWGTYSESPQAL